MLLAVLELEADERRARRVTRLRRASKLPPGKTFDTLDEGRLPAALVRKLRELSEGDFLSEATNVLASAAWRRQSPLVCRGTCTRRSRHSVLFMPTYSLVQIARAKRALELPAPYASSITSRCCCSMTRLHQQAPRKPRCCLRYGGAYERRSILLTASRLRTVGPHLRDRCDGRRDRRLVHTPCSWSSTLHLPHRAGENARSAERGD